ncbi:MAG: radical SAM protein, partial [Deltaproteobacteria bacterium]|nr:radical SAM protein [Deltaproteobacteria bacterium]
EARDARVHVAFTTHFLAKRESVLKRLEEDLVASQARLVAIPFNLTRSYSDAADLARRVRRCLPAARIVVGGNHATCAGEALLREVPEVDVLVKHEGEQALLALLRGDELASIPGLVYRGENGLCQTSARPPLADLDELPSPFLATDDFELYKRLKLMRTWTRNFSFDDTIFSRMVLTSRGCPFACEFCTNEVMTKRRMRFHSVDYVRTVVGDIRERFLPHLPFPIVNLADAIFTAHKQRTLELARALESSRVQFHCQTHAECIDGEILEGMRRMGMTCVSFGIESLSPAVFRRTGKSFTVEGLSGLVSALHQNGIRAVGTFIVGLPGDSAESIVQNAWAARRCGFDEAYFFPLVAVLGSRIHEQLLVEVPELQREWLGQRENREFLYTARFSAAELNDLARLSETVYGCP